MQKNPEEEENKKKKQKNYFIKNKFTRAKVSTNTFIQKRIFIFKKYTKIKKMFFISPVAHAHDAHLEDD